VIAASCRFFQPFFRRVRCFFVPARQHSSSVGDPPPATPNLCSNCLPFLISLPVFRIFSWSRPLLEECPASEFSGGDLFPCSLLSLFCYFFLAHVRPPSPLFLLSGIRTCSSSFFGSPLGKFSFEFQLCFVFLSILSPPIRCSRMFLEQNLIDWIPCSSYDFPVAKFMCGIASYLFTD
jgi:hypothetical protein